MKNAMEYHHKNIPSYFGVFHYLKKFILNSNGINHFFN